MKRDLDYIRELLLEIEENCEIGSPLKKRHAFDDKEDNLAIKTIGHVKLLLDEDFIEVVDGTDQDRMIFIIRRLTSKGHDYLDTVRDPKVWKSTKEGLKKVSGSTSLAVIQALAVANAKQILGLP